MGQTSPRLRSLNDHPLRPSGAYVLYWMTGSRRLHSNFALQHAHSLATELGCPLLIFEPISISFPWASTRFLRFVVEGMQEKRALAAELGVTYLPWVETKALPHSCSSRQCFRTAALRGGMTLRVRGLWGRRQRDSS